ncbi:MAG: YgiQ family radical SAM protein, partial [Candidatus Firestonebacteria bacterium]
MFIPTTAEELSALKWGQLDIILVTGDAYVDSPFIGVAVIARVLQDKGYKVGVIGQPDITCEKDITRLGEPKLFWGVTAGSVDSMVANFTALQKRINNDDMTPGGENDRRPDRAVIAYTNLIKKYNKNKKPIVLGGLEASLRRVSHYDYWSDKIRRSVLFDAKADILVYGMGEKAVLALADAFRGGKDPRDIRGICYASAEAKPGYLVLPSYEETLADKNKFMEMFKVFYENNDCKTALGLCQKQDTRYLIQNPPSENLTTVELDKVYELGYEREAHPYYAAQGEIRALETIRFSVTSHRGCYGECNFCSITAHQGTTVVSRSEDSIIKEVKGIVQMKNFKGYITDIGGPTANMYGIECTKKQTSGMCSDKRCLFPQKCKNLEIDHLKQLSLLRRLRQIKEIKKVFIASGIRYDMVFEDKKRGLDYINELAEHHVSGQLKIAPEHSEFEVLKLMGKPSKEYLEYFKHHFDEANTRAGKRQFLSYYFVAAHPGCNEQDMRHPASYAAKTLHPRPEQVQV